ncbi:hypothetical protein Vadar_002784 [Vaccinium darrowii]|uniref:Uncharacterized protein n=1 Tax=Vaccinium darrowii TaxID=229202 RepID=A0ACB7YIT9_9ERIC|nr:hypothetical protein Vadar_002784 [Vaccinium darrowii]
MQRFESPKYFRRCPTRVFKASPPRNIGFPPSALPTAKASRMVYLKSQGNGCSFKRIQCTKAGLGDSIYRSITSKDYFDPDHFLSTMDLSSEHKILDLKNRIEASVAVWKRKMNARDGKSSWGLAQDPIQPGRYGYVYFQLYPIMFLHAVKDHKNFHFFAHIFMLKFAFQGPFILLVCKRCVGLVAIFAAVKRLDSFVNHNSKTPLWFDGFVVYCDDLANSSNMAPSVQTLYCLKCKYRVMQAVDGSTLTQNVVENSCQLCAMNMLVYQTSTFCSSCNRHIKHGLKIYWGVDEMGKQHCFCTSCFMGSP